MPVNPTDAMKSTLQDVESAARSKGLQIQIVHASTSRERKPKPGRNGDEARQGSDVN
jgi:hypothetical protein